MCMVALWQPQINEYDDDDDTATSFSPALQRQATVSELLLNGTSAQHNIGHSVPWVIKNI